MALILRGESRCAVCDRVLQEGVHLVATSHFIVDQSDPLWRFSDAPFHEACFLGWPQRHEFMCRFNEVAAGTRFANGKRHYMTPIGEIEEGDDGDALNARCDSLWVLVDELAVTPPLEPLEQLLEPGHPGSKAAKLRTVWEELTRPEHVEIMDRRLKQELNPSAREWTLRAAAACKARVE